MKILIHGRAFPVAMWRWFDWSLRDLGHEVFSVGCYYGDYIPWNSGMNLDGYDFPPDLAIPEVEKYPIEAVLGQINFKPDVIIQASDVTYLSGEAPCLNVLLKTDPHAVDYTPRLEFIDHVFNMQGNYCSKNETWIPYAYFPPVHKYIKLAQEYDVVFSGLMYDHRKEALDKMIASGLKVFSTTGIVYENFVETYNKGGIAFNWSSKDDLPARFWEGLAMRRMVLTNRIPDLEKLEFVEGKDYVGFRDINDAVEKAKYYSEHTKERDAIAFRGWKKVKKHTYYNRVQKMINVINQL